MGFPVEVLNNIRRFVNTTLDKTGEIHGVTRIPNDEGGDIETWAPLATGVKFSVSEGFGGMATLEAPILERIGTNTPYFLTFREDVTINVDCRIYETFPEARTFNVVAIPNKDVSNQADTRVIATELG